MNHLDWEEQLLEEGWESLGQQHICFYGEQLYFELSSYQNFEECIVMLKILLDDEQSLDWDFMKSNESGMQDLLAQFFSSDQWQENWSWSEDEPGLIVYDLVDTDAIQKLISNEQKLASMLIRS